jgi:hypothetical protein
MKPAKLKSIIAKAAILSTVFPISKLTEPT